MDDVGIALFVYERPSHTERVLEGLRRNGVDHLYVFADGPKPDDDPERIAAVRDVVHGIDWCDTTVVERTENFGLAKSTVNGVNYVLDRHDKIIVLEDDDVPSADFIDYMRACLSAYEDEPRVMNVTGYSPPIVIPDDYEYDVYFTYRDCSWSWGTWKEAWDRYEYRPDHVVERVREDPEGVRAETRKAGTDLYPILEQAVADENDSWSVWWAWALLENDGLSVNPVRSRVKNIGHDGTGTHSKSTGKYDVEIHEASAEELALPAEPTVDERINRRFNEFKTRGKVGRVVDGIKRFVGLK